MRLLADDGRQKSHQGQLHSAFIGLWWWFRIDRRETVPFELIIPGASENLVNG